MRTEEISRYRYFGISRYRYFGPVKIWITNKRDRHLGQQMIDTDILLSDRLMLLSYMKHTRA